MERKTTKKMIFNTFIMSFIMFLFPKTVYKINAIQIEVIVSRNKISSDCNYGPEGTANNVLQLSSIALEIK